MKRKEYDRASKMLDDLITGMVGLQAVQPGIAEAMAPLLNTAARLKKMLTPPPTMEEILWKVPGATHTERAKEIGISRQGYYNIMGGIAKPNTLVAKRLSELTGVRLETIKEIW